MNRTALLGGVLLVAGFGIAVALLLSFPAMLFGGCTDVGVPAGEGQGVGVVGVADGNLLYTPDGVNECSIPLPAVGIPTGLIAVGTGLVVSQRVAKN
jgi:hypothetical protein